MASETILNTLDEMMRDCPRRDLPPNVTVSNWGGLQPEHPFWKLTKEERLEVYRAAFGIYETRG